MLVILARAFSQLQICLTIVAISADSSKSLYARIRCWRRNNPGPSISNPNLKERPKTRPRVGKSMRWTPLCLGFRVRTAWRGGRNLSNCCLASLIVWITSFGSLPKYAKILGGSARVEKNREAEKYAHSEERASARPHTQTHTHTEDMHIRTPILLHHLYPCQDPQRKLSHRQLF